MTRDEILNMPAGGEMDALIAEKVMKLDLSAECDGEPNFFDTDRWECSKCGAVGRVWDDMEHTIEPKEYSTDIAAAWEVVEKLKEHPRSASVYSSAVGWMCNFDGMAVASAETAPLAICRAALLAIMEK